MVRVEAMKSVDMYSLCVSAFAFSGKAFIRGMYFKDAYVSMTYMRKSVRCSYRILRMLESNTTVLRGLSPIRLLLLSDPGFLLGEVIKILFRM